MSAKCALFARIRFARRLLEPLAEVPARYQFGACRQIIGPDVGVSLRLAVTIPAINRDRLAGVACALESIDGADVHMRRLMDRALDHGGIARLGQNQRRVPAVRRRNRIKRALRRGGCAHAKACEARPIAAVRAPIRTKALLEDAVEEEVGGLGHTFKCAASASENKLNSA